MIGHDAAWAEVERTLAGGRFPHGWLLAGPRGLGKGGFAARLAAHLVGSDNAAPAAIAAHPDIIMVEREIHPDRKELRRNITVDQVRKLLAKLNFRPSLGPRRAIIIDAADDLESAAANALLKGLEEPPVGTHFLLVSHSAGRLLPTIRSRCRPLRFAPLDDDAMAAFMDRELAQFGGEERAALLVLAGGCPGRAVHYAALGLSDVAGLISRIECGGTGAQTAAAALADLVGRKEAAPLYDAALDLMTARLAQAARAAAADPGPAVEAWSQATQLVSRARRLTLDKAAVTLRLCDLLAGVAVHRDQAA